ncbi:ATP-binding cassette domain-containing protein [Conexibacter arvalis]|uniref:ATPase subunit of ABC transporter with duplicated ATPase domains n=1 Tax=Conexibacter arvalis TaxID=912552 RepID=A0A840IB52_9ACTN|nr:ATP-binding cassette domain-containing protein [Conexibacter arvalis]MBB4662147.1 ATPase subunit of ABC transporter with duplicated ATPase domains [Conexibacter arvalis]
MTGAAHLEVRDLRYVRPDGRLLLDGVSFAVGGGETVALVGPNGGGKTTLLRLIAGELHPDGGSVTASAGVGFMPQLIGAGPGSGSVRDQLLAVAPPRIRRAAAALARAEARLAERGDEATQLAYAAALAEQADAGGYELEVVWDAVARDALGLPYAEVADRPVASLSGGERKRLVLEALLRGPDEIVLLDEPDNALDVPAKERLEHDLRATAKTVVLVSHDRQVIAAAADRVVTVEDGGVWVHPAGFATYAEARRRRLGRLEARRRDWNRERARLRQLVHARRQSAARNDGLAGSYRAAQARLARFEAAGPPTAPPQPQNVRMRLRGGRTGKQAVIAERLAIPGLLRPFDLEVWFGERVALHGANGVGKSRFLELLADAGRPGARMAPGPSRPPHDGTLRFGARVLPGLFVQTHRRPDLHGRTPAAIVMADHALESGEAIAALARYELAATRDQPFETLSGGEQARLQILLLELAGATLLLLDEPTDNLDLHSADALQQGLQGYAGAVLFATHDRWFAADADRRLHFADDGSVREA